jgi:hypothetical protein
MLGGYKQIVFPSATKSGDELISRDSECVPTAAQAAAANHGLFA